MKKILVFIATLIASPAFADGFVCVSAPLGLKVHVYNQTQPALGTRSAAIMILSDMNVQAGRKTIATFKSADALLANTGALYTANVDLRFRDSSRQGENIAGTKLGEVDQVLLDVSFSYDDPVQDGTDLDGQVTIVKRNGEKNSFYAICTRYLKSE